MIKETGQMLLSTALFKGQLFYGQLFGIKKINEGIKFIYGSHFSNHVNGSSHAIVSSYSSPIHHDNRVSGNHRTSHKHTRKKNINLNSTLNRKLRMLIFSVIIILKMRR